MAVVRAVARKIPKWKIEQVQLVKELASKYSTIAVADITYVSAPVLHQIRWKLKERGDVLRVVKNRLAERGLRATGKKKIEDFIKFLRGSNALIFTNMNPFELKQFLDKNKVSREARAGDIAPRDIVLEAGNTNLPPGPILSLFSKFKVPTRIEEGSIWIQKDTVVVRKGEVISQELADLLKRLDIKPIEVGLKLKAAYSEGLVFTAEDLELNLEEYKNQIAEAYISAVNLVVNAVLPVSEYMDKTVRKAYLEALSLAYAACLPVKEVLEKIIAKAEAEAKALYSLLENKIAG